MSIQNKVAAMTARIEAERPPAPRPPEVPPLVRMPAAATLLLFGKPTGPFSSGTTITLDPCDIHGVDNGLANVTAYVQPSRESYSMTNSTTIPITAICPYVRGGDGYYYLLGNPIEIVTDVDVSPTVMTKKTRNAWVLTVGTESDPAVTIDTFTTSCP